MIDCDVHESLRSTGDLVKYLDEVWRPYRPQLPSDPYRVPAHAGGSPYLQATVEEVKRYLQENAIDKVLLTGAIYPGSGFTQVEYHLALTTAYNRWLVDEWLARDHRLYGSIQVALHRPEQAAGEIDRAAQNPRMLQVVLPAICDEGLGLPRYRPIFEAAARNDIVVALRSSPLTRTAIGYPPSYTEWRAGVPQAFMSQLMNIIVSGVFDEHPNLRVLVLEAGFTWLPYLTWTMDTNYKALRSEVPWLQRKPSEYIADHVFVGTHPMPGADAKHVEQIIDMVGSDGWLVFASDFPNRGHDLPTSIATDLTRNAERLYGARL